MQAEWTHHLPNKEDKERFEKQLKANSNILERQIAILEKWEDEVDSRETSKDIYDSPGWVGVQADNNGYRRALRRFKKLLTLDHKEK